MSDPLSPQPSNRAARRQDKANTRSNFDAIIRAVNNGTATPDQLTEYNKPENKAAINRRKVAMGLMTGTNHGVEAAGGFGQGLERTANNATNSQIVNGLQTGDSNIVASQKDAANNSRQQAGRMQADAQRGYQIGSRDARVEASKDAAASSAAQFQQSMNQQSAASGAGAAVLASANVQNPTETMAEHRQRADAQHLIGTEHMEGAEGAQQDALTSIADAEILAQEERDLHNRQLEGRRLALAREQADLVSGTEVRSANERKRQAIVDREMARGSTREEAEAIANSIMGGNAIGSDKRIKRFIKILNRRF